MPTWTTDARHLPPTHARVPADAHRRGELTRALIEAATSRLGEPRWRTSVRCIAPDGAASLEVLYDGVDQIRWWCTTCGDNGVITGFVGSAEDLSVFVMLGEEVTWSFEEDHLELLRRATVSLPELRGTVVRAEPDGAGRLVVRASPDELDDLRVHLDQLARSSGGRAHAASLASLAGAILTALDGASSQRRGS